MVIIILFIAIFSCAVIDCNAFQIKSHNNNTNNKREFGISADGTTFLKDGEPFRIVSAAFHYFRAPAAEWEDRLKVIRAVDGMNTIETYVAWNYHCPDKPDQCDFSGDKDLFHFLDLCVANGFNVILRPGPYICAEWEFGGFPAWLLKDDIHLPIRSSNPAYMAPVRHWLGEVLLPRVKPYLYGHNGPVLMVQVENELGFYKNPVDKEYLIALRDIFRTALGPDVLLFQTDPAGQIKLTPVQGVFPVIDFFSYGTLNFNIEEKWAAQRAAGVVAGVVGPPMNSEFYPGWLSQWFDSWVISFTVQYVDAVTYGMLVRTSNHSNVNFYMFFGGTNFGFWAGSGCTTSYDYGAPINESGHPTDKFFSLKRNVFPHVLGIDHTVHNVPTIPPVTDYGTVHFTRSSVRPLMAPATIAQLTVGNPVTGAQKPLSMEQIGQSYGFTLYEMAVVYPPTTGSKPPVLKAISLAARDYGMVFLDGTYVGHLMLKNNRTIVIPSELATRHPTTLTVVVENTGRIHFPSPGDVHAKGIIDPIEFKFIGHNTMATNITIRALPMKYEQIQKLWKDHHNINHQHQNINGDDKVQAGYFARGILEIPESAVATGGGTLLDLRPFRRGFVFVNGHNLGRFWSLAGPQYSLYCPRSYLRAGANEVIVFEQFAQFTGAGPATVPSIDFSRINHNIRIL